MFKILSEILFMNDHECVRKREQSEEREREKLKECVLRSEKCVATTQVVFTKGFKNIMYDRF